MNRPGLPPGGPRARLPRIGLPRLGLLRQRGFAVLFGARAVSVLGNAFAPIAVAFGILALPGAGPGTLALVVAAQAVPQLILLLFGGVVADRFPRDKVLVVAETTAGLAYGGMAAAMLSGGSELWLLIGCAVLAGAASALLFPALSGVVPDVVAADDLQQANALLALVGNVCRVGGLLLAGAAVVLIGPAVALAIDAATYLVAAALLWSLRLPAVIRPSKRRIREDLAVGWREFSGRTWLWVTVTAAAFVNAASRAGFGVLGPLLADLRLGGAFAWSVVLSAYAVGMIAGVLVAGRINPGRPLYVAGWCVLLLPAPFVGLAFELPVLLLALLAFGAGVAFDVFGVLWQTTMQRNVPSDVLSRVSSYEYVGAYALGPLGVALAAPLQATVGIVESFWVLAAVMGAAGLVICATPDVRRLRRSEK